MKCSPIVFTLNVLSINMQRLYTHLLFFLIIFLSSNTLNAQNPSKENVEKLLIGTWGKGLEYYTDINGVLKDRSEWRISIFDENDSVAPWIYDSLQDDLNLNSVFEGLLLYEGEQHGYPFRYSLKDDTLNLNGNLLLIEEITNKHLLLKDLPNPDALIDLNYEEGDSKWTKYSRIDQIDIKSNGPSNSELVLGEWILEHLLVVKTEGYAWAMEPVGIKDTLSIPVNDAQTIFNFSDEELKMYEIEETLKIEPIEYDITGDVIRVMGEIFFTILEINEDELSLLGIHGTDIENGQPLMIWKLKRYYSGR